MLVLMTGALAVFIIAGLIVVVVLLGKRNPAETLLSIDAQEQNAKRVLQDAFSKFARCDFDKSSKTYTIIATDQTFAEIVNCIDNPGTPKTWDSLVNSTTQLSQTIFNKIGGGYTVLILNPANADTVLLSIFDGAKTYDFAEAG